MLCACLVPKELLTWMLCKNAWNTKTINIWLIQHHQSIFHLHIPCFPHSYLNEDLQDKRGGVFIVSAVRICSVEADISPKSDHL